VEEAVVEFRKYDSWGITEDVHRTVKANGAEKVVILCEGKDNVEGWVRDIYDWFTSSHTYWWKDTISRDIYRSLCRECFHTDADTPSINPPDVSTVFGR